MKKAEGLDLKEFEQGTEALWAGYKGACKEVDRVFNEGKTVTDKTKLAAIIIGGMAKLKGAEVHRMAMEVMVRRKALSSGFAELPEPK